MKSKGLKDVTQVIEKPEKKKINITPEHREKLRANMAKAHKVLREKGQWRVKETGGKKKKDKDIAALVHHSLVKDLEAGRLSGQAAVSLFRAIGETGPEKRPPEGPEQALARIRSTLGSLRAALRTLPPATQDRIVGMLLKSLGHKCKCLKTKGSP